MSTPCSPRSLFSATTSKSYSVSSVVGCCSYMLRPLELVCGRPEPESCERDTTDCMATNKNDPGGAASRARACPQALARARAAATKFKCARLQSEHICNRAKFVGAT